MIKKSCFQQFFKVSYLIGLALLIACSSDSPLDPDEDLSNIPIGDFSLLSPADEITHTGGDLVFSWERPKNSDSSKITYHLLLGTNNPPSTVIKDDIEKTEYTLDVGLETESTYYWQVIANNPSGEKTKSTEIFSFTYMKGSSGSGVIANDDLGMPLRYRHSLEVFDGKLWMFAGMSGGHEEQDIWYSEDGIEWTKAVDFSDFQPRFSHTSLVYDNKMWIMGGTVVGGFFNDVWNTEDGVHWHEVTNSAPFGSRFGHSSVVFDNKMWIIGGVVIDQEETAQETVNDIWFSIDGKSWTQATENADFQPRLGHQSVVFDNKIWVIGGFKGDKILTDVWYSENGTEWSLATDNIGTGDITSYESIVYDDKIWLIGGTPEGDGVSGDIWYSSDGKSWKKATPFFGRVDHAVTVFQGKIWGVGGLFYDSDPYDVNDSWYLNLP